MSVKIRKSDTTNLNTSASARKINASKLKISKDDSNYNMLMKLSEAIWRHMRCNFCEMSFESVLAMYRSALEPGVANYVNH